MRTSKLLRTVQYLFAVCVAFGVLAPIGWLFISSISYQSDLTSVPLKWIPKHITFQRYIDIFVNPNNNAAHTFKIAMLNSIEISISVMIIALFIGGLAAYAFARLKFRFRASLIYLFLFTYMIPPVVIVIPLYLFLSNLHMLNHKWTLILVDLTLVIPFVIWVMQSYFASFSKSYEEAAAIDGCNRFQTLWFVILPIVRPGLIATAILSFLLSWDEFL